MTAPVRIHMDPRFRGSLGYFGYRTSLPPHARARYLMHASKFWGMLYVIRKLHALYILQRHRRPDLAAVFKADRDLVRAAYAAVRGRHMS